MASSRTVNDWQALIDDAVSTADPQLSNFKITRVHYLLSLALIDAIGADAGANFHSWAVWGSRKAGVTIRQEDRDQASRDATVVAGIVGALVGVGVGMATARWLDVNLLTATVVWVALGVVVGGYCGYRLAGYTRSRAASLILRGNRIVLQDIGAVTAQYLDCVHGMPAAQPSPIAVESFLNSLRTGPTEREGQDLLREAFRHYEQARTSDDPKHQHECNYFANCLAVLHEHIRLQPIIRNSLPWLISKCVTQRLMTYSVGQVHLAVHDDVPPIGDAPFPPTLAELSLPALNEFLSGPNGWDVSRGDLKQTRARDWTNIRERMGYIVNLFRTRHLSVDVVNAPYDNEQLEAISQGQSPQRPW
ncbi:MAG: hypothetical protein H6823_17545 [Planctomycetaceae bacterium]|nr:hypothetical protein [Planctomycetales bacterium]MCB9940046.1 hypothetical protein [Planctomycetaceae bacterium]